MNVLILGSGQLARMMKLAAIPMGIDVAAVDVSTDSVWDPVGKVALDIPLAQAIDQADVISVEFEHIPQKLLDRVNATGKLYPSIESIMAGADRVKEKALLESLGVANCQHRIVTDVEQLPDAVDTLGEKLILKASRDGYDGYGQWRLSDKSQLAGLQQTLSDLDLQKVPLVVEQMSSFDRELSLLAVRNTQGEIVCYPLAENLHHEGQLHVSVAPAPHVTDEVAQQANDIASKLLEQLNYVGVLAIEFFQVGEQLLVNEIAPRVHNSGHWSMQGADTSQFDNHIRAICGLPLGDTRPFGVSAMVNVIGTDGVSAKKLTVKGTHFHDYDKTVRVKRKMGHINVNGKDFSELGERLSSLTHVLSADFFPKLAAEAKRLSKLA